MRALAFLERHREDRDWLEHGSLLMVVSVVVTPYFQGLDQTALLPALLHALYRSHSRGMAAILALLSAAISAGNFLGIPIRSVGLYVWTAPAWLGWYFFATRGDVFRGRRPVASDGTGSGRNFRECLDLRVCDCR